MCEIYRIFSREWESCCDFNEERMVELYYSESYGDPIDNSNGYYVGKRWLNVTVSMWKQDITEGNLYLYELYRDGTFPHWWLDKVFKKGV